VLVGKLAKMILPIVYTLIPDDGTGGDRTEAVRKRAMTGMQRRID